MPIGRRLARHLAAAGILLCSIIAASAHAEQYVRTNRWTGVQLHIEHGAPEASKAGPGWWSAQWWIVPDGSDGGITSNYLRIKNRWTGAYLSCRGPYSAVVVGTTPPKAGDRPNDLVIGGPTSWHIEWTSEGYARLQWNGQYLNVEKGVLAVTPIQPSWWSAQWRFEDVN